MGYNPGDLQSAPEDLFVIAKINNKPQAFIGNMDAYDKMVSGAPESYLGRLFRESLALRFPEGLTGQQNRQNRAVALEMYRRLNFLGRTFQAQGRELRTINPRDFYNYRHKEFNYNGTQRTPEQISALAAGEAVELISAVALSSGLVRGPDGKLQPQFEFRYAPFEEDDNGVDFELNRLRVDVGTGNNSERIAQKLGKLSARNRRDPIRPITAMFVPLRRQDDYPNVYDYYNKMAHGDPSADGDLPFALEEIGNFNAFDPMVLEYRPFEGLNPQEQMIFNALMESPDNIVDTVKRP